MGRHVAPAGHLRARSAAVAVALATLLLAPALALAHPLGNFTINHYADVRVEPDRILLDVVIDQAEIAAFQSRQGFDLDADGSLSDEEIDAGRLTACDDLAPDLRLTVDAVEMRLRTIEAGLTFPPGVGGLSTLRLVCGFEASLATPLGSVPIRIAFNDDSYPNRIGWREILATGSEVTLAAVEGELRDASISQRLTTYPQQLIAQPLADQGLVVDAIAGGPAAAPFDIPDADPVAAAGASAAPAATPTPGASGAAASPSSPQATATPAVGAVPGGVSGGDLPEIFRQDLTPLVLLLSLVSAAALGAGHAITPGHGKTLMAAYLVGTRGTRLHAIGLALSVSISHTVGIVLLAAIVNGASDVLPPDVVVRWAPVVAALSIVAIGGWMLIVELRRRRAARWAAGTPMDGHEHALEHSHGSVTHSHAPIPGSTITWRSLFALGLAGGLIPSTSALLILLGSIAAGRPAFGFVLVVAFGLGMAAVMGGIGLAMVAARDRLDRLPSGAAVGRIRDAVPLVAATLVVGFGMFLTVQAIGVAPAF